MSGYSDGLPGVSSPDDVFSGISGADVSATNGDPFTSNTQSVVAKWPGNSLTVLWQSTKIRVGSNVLVTPRLVLARVRQTYQQATVAGEVTIRRSSGSVADEDFHAVIFGAT